jgi:hypothetical protein
MIDDSTQQVYNPGSDDDSRWMQSKRKAQIGFSAPKHHITISNRNTTRWQGRTFKRRWQRKWTINNNNWSAHQVGCETAAVGGNAFVFTPLMVIVQSRQGTLKQFRWTTPQNKNYWCWCVGGELKLFCTSTDPSTLTLTNTTSSFTLTRSWDFGCRWTGYHSHQWANNKEPKKIEKTSKRTTEYCNKVQFHPKEHETGLLLRAVEQSFGRCDTPPVFRRLELLAYVCIREIFLRQRPP